jgi:hypothetical protein
MWAWVLKLSIYGNPILVSTQVPNGLYRAKVELYTHRLIRPGKRGQAAPPFVTGPVVRGKKNSTAHIPKPGPAESQAWPHVRAGMAGAHLVFNQPKFLLTAAVGPRPSQVVRSTALRVLFPELQGYIAPCPRLCMSPRLLLFL